MTCRCAAPVPARRRSPPSGSRALSITNGQVSLSGLRISGGNGEGETSSGSGGGILVGGEAALSLSDSVVSDNHAEFSGGVDLQRRHAQREPEPDRPQHRHGSRQRPLRRRPRAQRRADDDHQQHDQCQLRAAGRWAGLLRRRRGHGAQRHDRAQHRARASTSSPPTRARRVGAEPNDRVSVRNTILAANSGGACRRRPAGRQRPQPERRRQLRASPARAIDRTSTRACRH